MNGVYILSSSEFVTETICNWWLAGCVFLATTIICGIIGFFVHGDAPRAWTTIIGCLVGALAGIMMWIGAYCITVTPSAYETRYKVAVSDDVSMNEFMEKYEIIEQDGKIYTVRERD